MAFPSPSSRQLQQFVFSIGQIQVHAQQTFQLHIFLSIIPHTHGSRHDRTIFIECVAQHDDHPCQGILQSDFQSSRLFRRFDIGGRQSDKRFLTRMDRVSFHLESGHAAAVLVQHADGRMAEISRPVDRKFLACMLPRKRVVLLAGIGCVRAIRRFDQMAEIRPVGYLFSEI